MGKNSTMSVATIQMYHGTCTPLGDHTMMITQNRNSEERISTAAPRPPSTSCSKSSPVAGSDHATLRRTDHMRPSTPATVLAPTSPLYAKGGIRGPYVQRTGRLVSPLMKFDVSRLRLAVEAQLAPREQLAEESLHLQPAKDAPRHRCGPLPEREVVVRAPGGVEAERVGEAAFVEKSAGIRSTWRTSARRVTAQNPGRTAIR